MPIATPIEKKQLTVRIDQDILERLQMYSVKSRMPKSLLIQTAINDHLDKVKAPWPEEPDAPD